MKKQQKEYTDIEQIKAEMLTEKQLQEAFKQLNQEVRLRQDAQHNYFATQEKVFKDVNDKGEVFTRKGVQHTAFVKNSKDKYESLSALIAENGENLLFSKNAILSIDQQKTMMEQLKTRINSSIASNYSSVWDEINKLTKGGKISPHDSSIKDKFSNQFAFSGAEKLNSVFYKFKDVENKINQRNNSISMNDFQKDLNSIYALQMRLATGVQGVINSTINNQVQQANEIVTSIATLGNGGSNNPFVETLSRTIDDNSVKQVIDKSQRDINATLKHYKGNYGNAINSTVKPIIGKMKQNKFKLDDYAFFDFETIGKKGDLKSFAPTQLAIETSKGVQEYFFKFQNEQVEWIKSIFTKAESGMQLDDDEIRSIFSLAEFNVDSNGKLFATHGEYAGQGTITKKILEKARHGANMLQKYGMNSSDISSIFQNVTNEGLKLAGHNIRDFDTLVAEMSGTDPKVFTNMLDTVELARASLKLGTKRVSSTGDVKKLTGYDLDSLTDFFEITMDASKRHVASGDINFNKDITNAITKYISSNKGNIPKIDEPDNVSVGMIGTAVRSYMKKNPNSFTSDANGKENVFKDSKGQIVSRLFDSLLFLKNHNYSFEGISKIDNLDYAHFKDVETGQESHVQYRSVEELENIISSVIPKGFSQAQATEIGADDALASLFGNNGAFLLQDLVTGKSKSALQQARIDALKGQGLSSFGKLQDFAKIILDKFNNTSMTSSAKSMILQSIGKKMNISKNYTFSNKDIQDYIEEYSDGTVDSTKTAMRKILNKHRNGFEDASDFESLIDFIDNWQQSDVDFKQNGKKVWEFSQLMSNWLSASYKYNQSTSSVGNYVRLFGNNGLDSITDDYLNQLISNMQTQISTVQNKDGVLGTGNIADKLIQQAEKLSTSNNSFVNIKDVLTGEAFKKRLTSLGLKNVSTGDASTYDLIEQLNDLVISKGVGLVNSITSDAKTLKISAFDQNYKNKYMSVDENGEVHFDTSEMATFDIPLSDLTGIVKKNGMNAADLISMDMGANGEFIAKSTTQKALEALIKYMDSSIFSKYIKDPIHGEGSVHKAETIGKLRINDVLDHMSNIGTYASPSVKQEYKSMIESGGTPEQAYVKSSAISMIPYLRKLWGKIYNNDSINVNDSVNDSELKDLNTIFAVSQYDKANGTNLMSKVIESNQHYDWLTKQKSDKYKMVLDYFKKSPFNPAYEGLKEEAFTQQLYLTRGAHDITPFVGLNSEDNRATDQFFNYKQLSQQAIKDRETELQTTPFKINNGLNLHGNSDGIDAAFNIGYATDEQIEKAYKAAIEEEMKAQGRSIRNKKQVDKYARNKYGVTPGTYNDSAIIGGAIKYFQRQAPERKFLSEQEISSELKAKLGTKWLELTQSDANTSLNIKDKLLHDMTIGSGLTLDKDHYLRSITKTDKGYEMLIENIRGALSGEKVLTSLGDRRTAQGMNADIFKRMIELMSDENSKYYVKGITNKTDMLLGFEGMKDSQSNPLFKIAGKNVGSHLSGRLNYIVNDFLKLVKDNNIDDVTKEKAIKDAFKLIEGTPLGNLMGYQNGQFLVGQKNRSKGFMSRWDNPNMAAFTGKEPELIKLFDESNDGGLIGTFAQMLYEGIGINGKQRYDSGRLMKAANVVVANDAEYAEALGSAEQDYLDTKGRHRVGIREIDAIKRQFGEVRAMLSNSNNGASVDMAENHLKNYMSNNSSEMQDLLNFRDRLNQSIEDTYLYNAQDEKQRNVFLERNQNNIIRIRGGLVDKNSLQDNEIVLSDLLNAMDRKGSTLTATQYRSYVMGILRNKADELGIDINNAKIMADLGDSGILANLDMGKYADEALTADKLMFALTDPTILNNGLMPFETDTLLVNFLKTWNERLLNPNDIESQTNLDAAVNAYYNKTYNAANYKDSKLYKNANRVSLSHSGAAKLNSLNIYEQSQLDKNKSTVNATDMLENTMILSESQFRDMLKTNTQHGNKNNTKLRLNKNIENLKFQLQYLNDDNDISWLLYDQDGNQLQGFELENRLIDEIINKVSLQGENKSMFGLFNRYPSTSGTDKHFSHFKVDKTLAHGKMKIGAGLQMLTNADSDGDMGYFATQVLSGDFKDYNNYKKLMEQYELMTQLDDKVTMGLARRVFKDDPNKIKDFKKEDYDAALQAIGEGKDLSFIATLQAKDNKKYIGSLSNFGTSMRNILKGTGLDEIQSTDANVQKNALITRAAFEAIEQDAISSKKVAERLFSNVKNKLGNNATDDQIMDGIMSELGDFQSLLTMSDSLYKKMYEADDTSRSTQEKKYGRINRIVDFGKKIGIFGEGEDFLAKRQGWIAEERIKAITGKDFGPITEEDFINAFNEQEKVVQAKYKKSMFGLRTNKEFNMGTAFANNNTPAMLQVKEKGENIFRFGTGQQQREFLKSFGGFTDNKYDITKPKLNEEFKNEETSGYNVNGMYEEHSTLVHQAADAEMAKLKVSMLLAKQLGVEDSKLKELNSDFLKAAKGPAAINKSINYTTNDNTNPTAKEGYITVPMKKDANDNWEQTRSKGNTVVSPSMANTDVDDPWSVKRYNDLKNAALNANFSLNQYIDDNQLNRGDAISFVRQLAGSELGLGVHSAMEFMDTYERDVLNPSGQEFNADEYLNWLRDNGHVNYDYLQHVNYIDDNGREYNAFENFEENLRNSILSGWNMQHDERISPNGTRKLFETELGVEITRTDKNGLQDTRASGGRIDEISFTKGKSDDFILSVNDYKTGQWDPEKASNQLMMYQEYVKANLAKVSSDFFLNEIQGFYANGNKDTAGLQQFFDSFGLGAINLNQGAEELAAAILPSLYAQGKLQFQSAIYDLSPNNQGEWKKQPFAFREGEAQSRTYTLARNTNEGVVSRGRSAEYKSLETPITSDNYFGDGEQAQIRSYLNLQEQLRNTIVDLTKAYAELAKAQSESNGNLNNETVNAAEQNVENLISRFHNLNAEISAIDPNIVQQAEPELNANIAAHQSRINADKKFAGIRDEALDLFYNASKQNIVSSILSDSDVGFDETNELYKGKGSPILSQDSLYNNNEIIDSVRAMQGFNNTAAEPVDTMTMLQGMTDYAGGVETLLSGLTDYISRYVITSTQEIVNQAEQAVGKNQDINISESAYGEINRRLETIKANLIKQLQAFLGEDATITLANGNQVDIESFANHFMSVDEQSGRVTLADTAINNAVTRHNTTASNERAKQLQSSYFKTLKERSELAIELENLQAQQKRDGIVNQSYWQQRIDQTQRRMENLNQTGTFYDASQQMFYRYGPSGEMITGRFSDRDAQQKFEARNTSETRYYNQQMAKVQSINNTSKGIFARFYNQLTASLDHYLVSGMAYQVSGKLMSSVSSFIAKLQELDKTFVDLQIVTGKTRSEVKEMVKGHAKLALQLGATTQEVNAAANEFYRMGYNDTDTAKLIESSTMLSKLGMIDSSKASEYMISAIKGYDVDPNEAMKIVDMASELDMKYAVSAGYILEAMARTASSAKMAGVEMGDLQSLISIVGETTQKDASVVGESFKTAFARYGNLKSSAFLKTNLDELGEGENAAEYEKVNDIEKVLTKIGINVREDDLKTWRSYSDILKDVGTNWKNYTDYEKNAITTAMFGTRQRENGIVALDNYNRVLEASSVAANSAGTSYQKMEKYSEGLEAARKRLSGAFEALTSRRSGFFTEPYMQLLNIFTALITHAEKFAAILGGIILFAKADSIITTIGKLSNNFYSATGAIRNFKENIGTEGFGTSVKGIFKNKGREITSAWTNINEDAELHSRMYRQKYGKDAPDLNDNAENTMPFSEDEMNNNRDGNTAEKQTANNVQSILELLRNWFNKNNGDNDNINQASLNRINKNVRNNPTGLSRLDHDILKANEEKESIESRIKTQQTNLERLNTARTNRTKDFNKLIQQEAAYGSKISNLNQDIKKYEDILTDPTQILTPDEQAEYERLLADAKAEKFVNVSEIRKIRNAIKKIEQLNVKDNGAENRINNSINNLKQRLSNVGNTISNLNGIKSRIENIYKQVEHPILNRIKNSKVVNGIKENVNSIANGIKEKVDSIANERQSDKNFKHIKNKQRILNGDTQGLSDTQLAYYDQFDLDDNGNLVPKDSENVKTLRQIRRETKAARTPRRWNQTQSNALKRWKRAQLVLDEIDPNDSVYKYVQEEVDAARKAVITSGVTDLDNLKIKDVNTVEDINRIANQRKDLNIFQKGWNKTNKVLQYNTNSQALNNTLSMGGTMLGMYGGSQIGSWMGERTGSETGKGIGAMAGSLIGMAAPMMLGGPAGMVAGGVLATVGALLQWKQEKEDKALQKFSDDMDKLSTAFAQAKQSEDDVARYDKLALGVSNTGRNISLTDDEFEEFHTLGNKLKDIFPQLIIGVDQFGNALLGCAKDKIGGLSSAIDAITKSYQQQIDSKYFEEDEGTSLYEKDVEEKKKKTKAWNRKHKQQSETTDSQEREAIDDLKKRRDKLRQKKQTIGLKPGEQSELDITDRNYRQKQNTYAGMWNDLKDKVNEDIIEKIMALTKEKDDNGKEYINYFDAVTMLREYIRSQDESERRQYIYENFADIYATMFRNSDRYNEFSQDEQDYILAMLNNMMLDFKDDPNKFINDKIVNKIYENKDIREGLSKLQDESITNEEKADILGNLIERFKEIFKEDSDAFSKIAEALGYHDVNINDKNSIDKINEIIRKYIDPNNSIVTQDDMENKIKNAMNFTDLELSDSEKDSLIEQIMGLDKTRLSELLNLDELDFKYLIEGAENTQNAFERLTDYLDKKTSRTISELGSSIQTMANTLGLIDPKVLFLENENGANNVDTLIQSYVKAGKISQEQADTYKEIIENVKKTSKEFGISPFNLIENFSDFSGLKINGTSDKTSKQIREENEKLTTILNNLSNNGGKISQEDAETLESIAPDIADKLGLEEGVSGVIEAINNRLRNSNIVLRGVYKQEAYDSSNLWKEIIKNPENGIDLNAATAFSSYQNYQNMYDMFEPIFKGEKWNPEALLNSPDNREMLQEKMMDYMRQELKMTFEDGEFEEKFKTSSISNGLTWEEWLKAFFSVYDTNSSNKINAQMDIFANVKMSNVDASAVKTALENAFNEASTRLNVNVNWKNALNDLNTKGYATLEDYKNISTDENIIKAIGKYGLGYSGYYNNLANDTQTYANNLASQYVQGMLQAQNSMKNLTKGSDEYNSLENLANGYYTLFKNIQKADLDGMKQRKKEYQEALKDFQKQERDHAKQMRDYDKQERLNALNNLISGQKAITENITNMISAIDTALSDIGSQNVDFGIDLMQSKMALLVKNTETLTSQYGILSNQSHETAEETQTLANALLETGNNIISNINNLRNLRKEMLELGSNALNEALTNSTSLMDKQANFVERMSKRTSNYNDFLSNDYYTSGLFSSVMPQNVVEKQKKENEQLLQLQEYFNNEKLKLDKEYLQQLEQEQKEELERNRQDAIDSWEKTKTEFNESWKDMINGANIKAAEIEDNFKTMADAIKLMINGDADSIQSAFDSLGLPDSLKQELNELYDKWLKMNENPDEQEPPQNDDELPPNQSDKMVIEKGMGLNSYQKDFVKNTAAPIESEALKGLQKGNLVYASSSSSDGHSLLYLGNGWFLSDENGTATIKTEKELKSNGYTMFDYSDFSYNGNEVSLTDDERNMLIDAILEDKFGTIAQASKYAGQCLKWARMVLETTAENVLKDSKGMAKYPFAYSRGSMGRNAYEAANKYGYNVAKYKQTGEFFATGTSYSPEGLAVLGDEGVGKYELVVLPDGTIDLVGTKGAELVHLPQGTKVIPHTESKRILGLTNGLSNQDNSKVKFLADGQDYLGIVTAKSESGENPGTINYNEKSYGMFQFNKASGTLQRFINYLQDTNVELSKLLPSINADNFDSIWKQLATDSNTVEQFTKAQKDFAKKYFYDPIKELVLTNTGVDLSQDRALEELAFSTAIQYGTKSAAKVISKSGINNTMTVSEIIDTITKYKQDTVNTWFKSSSKAIQKAQVERFETEKSLLKQEYMGKTSGEKITSEQQAATVVQQLQNNLEEEVNIVKQYSDWLDGLADNVNNATIMSQYAYQKFANDFVNSDEMTSLLQQSKFATDIGQRQQADYKYNAKMIDFTNEQLKSMITIYENAVNEIEAKIPEMLEQGLDVTSLIEAENSYLEKIQTYSSQISENTASTASKLTEQSNELKENFDLEKETLEYLVSMGYITGNDRLNKTEDLIELVEEAYRENQVKELQRQNHLREQNIPVSEWYKDQELQTIIQNGRNLNQYKQDLQLDVNINIPKERNEFEQNKLENEKPDEWRSLDQIEIYYDNLHSLLQERITFIETYLATAENISEEIRNQYIEELNTLKVEDERTNALQKQQDILDFKDKQYSALTWQVNEYIDLLEDEKEEVNDRYDDEIEKLQKVNESKERSLELSKLLDNLENAKKEKKRVYRTGIGFVYEADRNEVKNAQDELDKFYREDRISDLEKARDAEIKVLDDRIDGWQKYLEALEDVYKTHEKQENQAILKNLLGVNTIAEINDILFNDRDSYLLKYKEGIKDYVGEFTGLLNSITDVQNQIANMQKQSLDLIGYSTQKNNQITPNNEWRWFASQHNITDYQFLLDNYSDAQLQEIYGVSRADIQAKHNKKLEEMDSLIASGTDLHAIVNGSAENNTRFTLDEIKTQVLPRKNQKILSVAQQNNLDDIINGKQENNTGLSKSELLLARKINAASGMLEYVDENTITDVANASHIWSVLKDNYMNPERLNMILNTLEEAQIIDPYYQVPVGKALVFLKDLQQAQLFESIADILTGNSINDYQQMIKKAIQGGLNISGILKGSVDNNSGFSSTQLQNDVLPVYNQLLENAKKRSNEDLYNIIANPNLNDTGLHLSEIELILADRLKANTTNISKEVKRVAELKNISGEGTILTDNITQMMAETLGDTSGLQSWYAQYYKENANKMNVGEIYGIVDENYVKTLQPSASSLTLDWQKANNTDNSNNQTFEFQNANFINLQNSNKFVQEMIQMTLSAATLRNDN